MKKSKFSLLLRLVQLALVAVLTLGVRFLFPACTAMEDECKSCVDCQNAIFAFGLAMLIIALVLLLCSNAYVRCGLSVSLIIVDLVMVILIPNRLISLCMMPDMACRAHMYPAVLLLGILIAVIAFVNLVINARKVR